MLIYNPSNLQMRIVEELYCKVCNIQFEPWTFHCLRCHQNIDVITNDHDKCVKYKGSKNEPETASETAD